MSTQQEKDKVIVFEKGDLLFIFNFHPKQSFEIIESEVKEEWNIELLRIVMKGNFSEKTDYNMDMNIGFLVYMKNLIIDLIG